MRAGQPIGRSLAFVAGALISAAALGQGALQPVPTGVINDLEMLNEAKQGLDLLDATLVSLDLPAVPEMAFKTRIPVDGQMVTLDLTPHSVRSALYEVRVQIEDGSYEIHEPGPVRTMRGTIDELPGAVVAASLMPEGLMANIILPDGRTVWVEPVGHRVARGRAEHHVVYAGTDVIPSGSPCGTDHAGHDHAHDHGEIASERGGGCQSTICVTQLACDADFEYFQDWGSISAVENRINNVINSVNNQYESQVNITHEITTIIVRTAEPDPYTSTNSDTLLGQFRSEWLNNQGSVVRDVAKLFTGKEIDSSVIGQAWTIGGICTTSAYCHSQSDCCGSFACTTDLCAHELGHLWGAFHCSCPSNTMNPSITCSNNFSSGSISSISSHRDSRSCLDPLESGNTTLPFFDSFPSTTINSTLWIGVDGATVDSVGNGEPSAPNSLRINGSDAIRSAYINASAADNITLSYWWQRTGGGNSPEAGEDLFVEYFDIFGNWTIVAQHPGNGGDTDPYQFNSVLLPNSAEHANLRIRFRGVSGNAGLDDYFVDDVSITADLALPGNFNLVTPSNGATNIDLGPFFDWNDSANATTYRLRVDDDPGFGSPIIDVNLVGSAANIGGNPLAQNTVYYWTVDAGNVNGTTTSTPASFSFTTEGGSPTGPQVRMERGSFAIDNGGVHDHGTTNQGVPLERAYRVYNDGTTTLNLSNLSVPSGYTITKNIPNNVLPGVSKTFKVQLDAVSQGTFNGTMSFNTNDADDNPFAFTVMGMVVQPPQPPTVRVTRGAFTIANGGVHNHGNTTVNVPQERAYKVWNDGDEQLQLSNLSVPTGYTITKALPPTVNGGASKVYKVALLSSTPGFFSGTMSFNTNDPDDNPFAFTVEGNVNGAFATGGPITPTADGPLAAAAADFTGDGRPDVILTHASDEVTLFAGNGQGGMTAYDSIRIRNGASGVAAGDLNNDGRPEAVVAGDRGLTILGNDGGILDIMGALRLPGAAVSVALHDLNDDGRLDIASVTEDGSLNIFLGVGAFAFEATDVQEASARPLGAAFGYFTADLTLDLAILDGDGTVTILGNDGAGRFAGVQSLRVSGAPFAIATGDVNGDAIDDVVVAHDTVLTVYAGNGIGGLESGRVWQVGSVDALALADLTNDGDAEVVVANGDEGTVTILVSGADGLVGHREVLPVGGRVTSLLGADVAGDGGVDVINIFGASSEIAVMIAGGRCTADINGDGAVDMLDINAVIEAMSAGEATFEDLNEVLGTLGSSCN